MAGKSASKRPSPEGTTEALSSFQDYRVRAREPSAKALGYFQQNSLRARIDIGD